MSRRGFAEAKRRGVPALAVALAAALVSTGCYQRVVVHPAYVTRLGEQRIEQYPRAAHQPTVVRTTNGRAVYIAPSDLRAVVLVRPGADVVLRPPFRIESRPSGWHVTHRDGHTAAVRGVTEVWAVRPSPERTRVVFRAALQSFALGLLASSLVLMATPKPGEISPGPGPILILVVLIPMLTTGIGTASAMSRTAKY